jgi:hypothetical protein
MTISTNDLSAIGRTDLLKGIGDAADVLVSQINKLEAGGTTKMQAGDITTVAFNATKGEVEALRMRYFDDLAQGVTSGPSLTADGLKMINQASTILNADWFKLANGTLDTSKVKPLAEQLARLNGENVGAAAPVAGTAGTARAQAIALLNSVPCLNSSGSKAAKISEAIDLIVPRASATSTSANALASASTTVSPTAATASTVGAAVPPGSVPLTSAASLAAVAEAGTDARAVELLASFRGATPDQDLVALIASSSLPEPQKHQLLDQAADVAKAIISVNVGDTAALGAAATKLDQLAGSVAAAYSGGSSSPVNSIALNLANGLG